MPSSESIDLTKADFKILEEKDNVSKFSCGVKEIDEFIHEEALDFQNERLGVTYLLYIESKILGFVTLSMADLRKEKMNRRNLYFLDIDKIQELLAHYLKKSVREIPS